MEKKVNRTYKDTVFRDLFGNDEKAKEKFLSLYNALHNTKLGLDTELKPLDIEQVMYMNLSNDIARLVDNKVIILAEHQSTINENMPIRCLQYIGRIYEQIQDPKEKYLKKLVKIPSPEFFVFYNGKADYPKEKTLKLSDAFIDRQQPNLELIVKVINTNSNKNNEVLDKCKTLKEYSIFVDTVNKNIKLDPKNGFTKAIKECLQNGILKEYLERKSGEVNNMLILDYDYEMDIAVQREEAAKEGHQEGFKRGHQEGLAQGHQAGIAQGIEQGIEQEKIEVVKNFKSLGIDVKKIAEATGLSLQEIEAL